MPEEECEDEPHSDAHDPSDEVEYEEPEVCHGAEDGVELWHRAELLRKDLGLLSGLLETALPGLLLLSIGLLLLLLHVVHGHGVGGHDRVSEGDLRGDKECAEHEEGEDVEADVVVLLRLADVAPSTHVRQERVVQHDAHHEHGQSPAEGAEHALAAVLVLVLLAQQGQHGGIGQRHRGGGEELADDDQEQDEEEDLLHPCALKDLVAECGRHPLVVFLLVVAGHEVDALRGSADSVARGPSMVSNSPLRPGFQRRE